MMSAGERQALAGQGVSFRALPDKCPCCPGIIAATWSDALAAPTAQAVFASLVSHPACAAQTECKRRIANDRTRHKRGPPATLFL